jgi:O-antigen ligase
MDKFFSFSISFLCLLPIIPNKIKGLPVIVFAISSLLVFINTKEKKINFKLILINSGILFFYVISLFYTENMTRAFHLLERSVSFFLFPILFFWFLWGQSFQNNHIQKLKRNVLNSYLIGALLFSLIMILNFFLFKDPYTTFPTNIYVRASVLHIPLIGQHAIYSSIYLAIGVIFGFYLFYVSRKKMYLFPVIIFSTLLFMLVGKATLLALLIISIFVLIKKGQKKIIIPVVLILLFSGLLIPSVKLRTAELFQQKTYAQIDNNNSSSIRFFLNKSSISLLKENWLFGLGIGDVTEAVTNRFHEKFNGKGVYGTHNQFFGFWLGTGIFGLAAFLVFLFYNFRLAWQTSDLLFLSLLILFVINLCTENILERQTGIILFLFLVNFFGFITLKEKEIQA